MDKQVTNNVCLLDAYDSWVTGKDLSCVFSSLVTDYQFSNAEIKNLTFEKCASMFEEKSDSSFTHYQLSNTEKNVMLGECRSMSGERCDFSSLVANYQWCNKEIKNVRLAECTDMNDEKRSMESWRMPNGRTMVHESSFKQGAFHSTSDSKVDVSCNIASCLLNEDDLQSTEVFGGNNHLKSSQKNLLCCDICKKRPLSMVSLKQYKLIHLDTIVSCCDLCSRIFPTRDERNVFICALCGKKISTANGLQQHWLVHTGEKAFKCDVCGKKFSHAGNLKMHFMTHTGEKEFKCDVCGKKFSHAGNLKMHFMTHTGEKEFKCDVCGKNFSHAANLKRHFLVHTGEKPFKCDLCRKGFTRANSLKIHQLAHERQKDVDFF